MLAACRPGEAGGGDGPRIGCRGTGRRRRMGEQAVKLQDTETVLSGLRGGPGRHLGGPTRPCLRESFRERERESSALLGNNVHDGGVQGAAR